jgi:cytochrome c2
MIRGVSRALARCAAVAAPALLAAMGAYATPLPPPARFPDPAAGQRLVLKKGCANCHGIAGPGGRQGPDLLRTARGKGADEVLADMWNHVPQMVEALLAGERLPSLSAGELRDLVGYFSFVNYLGDRGDEERGQALLAEMSCLGCHDLRRSGKIGPALVSTGRTASPVGLVTDLWNHYPNMSAALRAKGLVWFAWNGDAISDMSRYLDSLAPVGSPGALLAPGDPDEGARAFTRLGCAGCHTPAGGTAWVALVRASNRRSAAENGAALLRHLPRIIGLARRTAQPLRPLSETEMADLLAYLSLAGTELSGGDATKGKAAFERKRCAECHAVGGATPGIGPDVASMPPVADPYELAALMLQHAGNMKIATELKHINWPQMHPEELQDLYAFLSKEPRR